MGEPDDLGATAGGDARRLSHELVLSHIASDLLAAENDAVRQTVDEAVARLGDAFGADRAYMLVYDSEGRGFEMTSEWCRDGVIPVRGDFVAMSPAVERWWARRVVHGLPILVRDLDEVGSDDDPDGLEARALLEREGVTAVLMAPIVVSGRPRGNVALSMVGGSHEFDDDAAVVLQLAGQLVVNRLERARAEEALAGMAHELARRNAELERSNRQLEEFAYVASHDLKSPLLVVRGFLDLLERDKGGPLADDARSFVAAAIRGATRMERLIDDLLAYSRVGQRPLELEDVDLAELITWVLDDCDAVIKAGGATVKVGELPTVRGDRTQLAQAVQNLVDNAVKFARADTPPEVAISATRRGAEWVLCVRDNGVGIAAADREKVFAMFTRLESTVDLPGSGIGLAIAQRVVEAHGGQLWIAESSDAGTTFCLTIPA